MSHQRYYRFRSAAALLGGYQELERQEIYFTPPEDLNDALEGFTNVVWKGDRILWHNLLRHYVLCLIEATMGATVLGAEFEARSYRYLAWVTDEDLPDAPVRSVFRDAAGAFLTEPATQHLIAGLVERDAVLSRDELIGFLRAVHPLALRAVLDKLDAQGIKVLTGSLDYATIVEPVREMLDHRFALHDHAGDLRSEAIAIGETQLQQIDLLHDIADQQLEERRGWVFLFRDFPAFYADALARILFPEWLTACFVKHPTHASMWGVYADGHRGACLEFRTNDDRERRPALNLTGVIGIGGTVDDMQPMTGNQLYPFEPVRYAADYPETDFFRSLGRLPRSKLRDFWYSDNAGTVSPIGADILQGNETWRQAYWARHRQVFATKLPQWAHEEEYRLILSGDIDRTTDPSRRKLRYRFSDLTGVIFGMNMAHVDKIEMIRILMRKVAAEKHAKLRFSQAAFSHLTGRIEIRPLTLLSTQIGKLAEDGTTLAGNQSRTALETLAATVLE